MRQKTRNSQKKMYVMLNDHQVKNPPTVDRFTNQLNTVSESVDTFMNDKNANALAASTAKSGSPLLVQYANTFGACPRSASPYSTRDEQNRNELPAENADVNTPALMMCGSTLIPARVIAITYGDSAALPVSESRFGSL